MRRVLVFVLVVVTALLLQTTLFSDVTLVGAKPELVYLVAIVFAMLEGPATGATSGFVAGMAQDFLLNSPKGITALTLTLLGYVVGTLRQYIVSDSPLLPTVIVGAGTFAGILFYGLVSFLLGQLDESFGYVARIAGLSGLYNAILTPLLFPLLRRLAEGSEKQRVGRF
ncbi:MAG: rod shape-determining protein MreD [Actinomycetota bacterium]